MKIILFIIVILQCITLITLLMHINKGKISKFKANRQVQKLIEKAKNTNIEDNIDNKKYPISF